MSSFRPQCRDETMIKAIINYLLKKGVIMKREMINKLSIWILAMMLYPIIVQADLNRIQTIQLSKGWNAVYLEVDPEVHDPDKVFENLPVDLVATFYGQISSIQYIEDPGEGNWKTSQLFHNSLLFQKRMKIYWYMN